MITREVGQRGVLFTFEGSDYPFLGDTSVYLINTDNRLFLCDTHLGPASMEYVKQYIASHFGNKEIIVFNSHSDWDHIWGNCAFEHSVIIAHETCRERIIEKGEFDLERHAEHRRGDIELKLPNLTFNSRIRFEEDEIEFIYAPGHTIDSSICFDARDLVLFAGDLIECPVPYFSYDNLETYLKTLEFLRNLPAKVKISSHSGMVDDDLIDANITYVENILHNRPVTIGNEDFQRVHNYNMKNLLLLKYEDIARKRLKEGFDYKSFRYKFLNLNCMGYEDLEEALKKYIKEL